jgi:hypothetical protein
MVTCDGCGKTINDSKDVNVTALSFIFIKKFCNSCFSSGFRKFARLSGTYWPGYFSLNSTWYTGLLIGICVFVLVLSYIIFQGLLPLNTAIVNGKEVQIDGSLVFFIINLILFAFLIWSCFLWFKARSIVNEIKAETSKP